MKAWTETFGKRKREFVKDVPHPAKDGSANCNATSTLPITRNHSPPRKLLKPTSNIKAPDAPPPTKAKPGPRLKLERTGYNTVSLDVKAKAVATSRVTKSKPSTPGPTRHVGYTFDLKAAFNDQSKSVPVSSDRAMDKPVETRPGRIKNDKSASKLKFNWSDWGQKS